MTALQPAGLSKEAGIHSRKRALSTLAPRSILALDFRHPQLWEEYVLFRTRSLCNSVLATQAD